MIFYPIHRKELFELDADAGGKILLQIQVNVLFEGKGLFKRLTLVNPNSFPSLYQTVN